MTGGRYPGGKNGDGVYQTIINQIPPHHVYIEPFVGSGAILRHLRPAAVRIAVDLDPTCRAMLPAGIAFYNACGIAHLEAVERWTGREFVYCDPPYPRGSRRSQADLYRYEMTDADHERLLAVIRRLPCAVAISGYRCRLYDYHLCTWRRIEFRAQTRGGPATECLWMNYPAPAALHDYRYLGADFRERERIKKKARRWAKNVAALPALERQAVLSEMAAAIAQTHAPDVPKDGTADATQSPIAGSGDRIPSPLTAMQDPEQAA